MLYSNEGAKYTNLEEDYSEANSSSRISDSSQVAGKKDASVKLYYPRQRLNLPVKRYLGEWEASSTRMERA